jgi:type I restriction enzyme M protein
MPVRTGARPVALKKSQLYSSLWASCDELRGGMDASQYKDYVLTLLFVKYVSDKYAGRPNALIEIPEGGGFADIAALKGDKEIGDKINKIIGRLAEANDLKNVIDVADFNDPEKLGSGKEMQDRLTKLVAIFEGLDFRANTAEGDDLLGDAYEYLMRHFATESGKSKGQFYTPAEVSRIMAQVVGVAKGTSPAQTIYDPTCGSGSLLLKAADEAPRGVTIYGQEMDNSTWALARMNMILHGHETAEIWKGNTLASPYFKNGDGSLKTFDFAVANPPFSAKAWSTGLDPANDEFHRFDVGVPPAKNGDYAFLLHAVKSLKSTGKAAIILPHGVLFRGHREAEIRANLVKRGLIKGVIGLPPNLFYGTGIPACIVVIDKEGAAERDCIFMIDASKGFVKDGNKNRLRAQDIHKIVDVFNRELEVPRYSRPVPVEEIASVGNNYNLNLARYIDSSEPEDIQDLEAHLRGGIPERDVDLLSPYWEVLPSVRAELFTNGSRAGYCEPAVDGSEVRPKITGHPEYATFAEAVTAAFDEWTVAHRSTLLEFDEGALPRAVVRQLSEDVLERFGPLPLISEYEVYQRFMDYWGEVMQDDLYLIAAEGWAGATQPRPAIDDKAKKIKETPDLVIEKKKYKTDLIPPALLVSRFFADEQAEIERLEEERSARASDLEEFVEEHSGDEGLLEDAVTEKGTVTKKSAQARLKVIKEDPDNIEETQVVSRVIELIDADSAAAKAVKDAQGALDRSVLEKYADLSEEEIKEIVIDDKWFAALARAVDGELTRLTEALAARVRTLDERYATTVSALEEEVVELAAKVKHHLSEMGFAWA